MIIKNKLSLTGIRRMIIASCLQLRLTVMFFILILSITFGCQKFSSQKKTLPPPPASSLKKYVSNTFTVTPLDQQAMKRGMTLFAAKCSSCHDPNRAFNVIKDPEVWAQTIKRMQYYSKGAITNQEAKELVDFHIDKQQKEINAFQETCTKCHDDERINSRSMSEEQWLATIKRMQQKAPELINDEKVNLLTAYFHRRELAMARIFYGKCRSCHLESSDSNSTFQLNALIVLANEEFGRSMKIGGVLNLMSSHVERQKREMQIYENRCNTCHPNGLPEKKKPGGEKSQKERTRAEWISFIALLQGIELSKEIQNTINSQIDFHISKY